MSPDEEFATATQNLTESERTVLTQLSYVVQVIPDDVLDEILRVLKLNLTEPMPVPEEPEPGDFVLDAEDEAVIDAGLAAVERMKKADADETLGDVVAWRSEVFDGSTMLSFTEWQEDRRLLHPRRPENQA